MDRNTTPPQHGANLVFLLPQCSTISRELFICRRGNFPRAFGFRFGKCVEFRGIFYWTMWHNIQFNPGPRMQGSSEFEVFWVASTTPLWECSDEREVTDEIYISSDPKQNQSKQDSVNNYRFSHTVYAFTVSSAWQIVFFTLSSRDPTKLNWFRCFLWK